MWRHVVSQPDITTDSGMMADGNSSEDGSVGIDGNIVLNDGVSGDVEHITLIVVLEALGTEGNTLIKGDVVADDTGLTDNDARPMVDGKVFTYLGSRMDIDARFGVCQLSDDAWNNWNMQLVKLMGYAVMRHSVHDGIAEDDLPVVGGSRVVVEHGLNVGIEQTFDFGQRIDEFERESLGLFVNLLFGLDGLAVFTKLQSVGNLLDEQTLQFLHVNADIV